MYAPPELNKIKKSEIGKTIIPHKVDIFCFGMTFAELLFNKRQMELKGGCPVKKEEYEEFIKNIKYAIRNKRRYLDRCHN